MGGKWENTFITKWDEKHFTFGKNEVRAKASNLWYEIMVDETGITLKRKTEVNLGLKYKT